jgi:hypothetical protein
MGLELAEGGESPEVLDIDGDGDTEVEIPDEIIVREVAGNVIIEHPDLIGGYAQFSKQEIQNPMQKTAEYGFSSALLGTVAVGSVGAAGGHVIGAVLGLLREKEIEKVLEKAREESEAE